MTALTRLAMPTIVKFAGASLGERQVAVDFTTSSVDRMDEIIEAAGVDTKAYMRNPIVLWQHDPATPIARTVQIDRKADRLSALVQFPPEGTSDKADEIYRLIKSDIVRGASIGFIPIEAVPMDAKQPWGAQRYKKIEMMEFSFVGIPCNRDALITAKAASTTPRLDAARAKFATMRLNA
jgi:HK97 family phage prohead protease